MDLTAMKVITIIFSGITAVSHMVGVAVLFKLKVELNQSVIIVNLAVIECIMCLNFSTLSLLESQIPYMSISMFSTLGIRMIMLVLVCDRFLEIYLNITYCVIVTRQRVFKLICMMWIISGIYGLAQGMIVRFGDPKTAFGKAFYVHNYILSGIDTIFTIAAAVTYSYFYCKIRSIRKEDKAQRKKENTKCNQRGHCFNYKIPFVIISTYLTFNLTATVLFQVRRHKLWDSEETSCTSCELLLDLARFSQIAGALSDSIVYIVLQDSVKNFFKRKILPSDTMRDIMTSASHTWTNKTNGCWIVLSWIT